MWILLDVLWIHTHETTKLLHKHWLNMCIAICWKISRLTNELNGKFALDFFQQNCMVAIDFDLFSLSTCGRLVKNLSTLVWIWHRGVQSHALLKRTKSSKFQMTTFYIVGFVWCAISCNSSTLMTLTGSNQSNFVNTRSQMDSFQIYKCIVMTLKVKIISSQLKCAELKRFFG